MDFLGRAVREFESSMLFFPQPQLRGNPAHLGLDYEDVWLTAEDGVRVHAWFIRGEKSSDSESPRISMLMMHGNGGNISVRLDQYAEFIKRFQNIDILSLSYRGYGISDGMPSEEGFALDARAAYEWLQDTTCQTSNIIVFFGRSLGGAVAARLAVHHRPDVLILECAPSSIPFMARSISPWKYFPLEKMIANRFETVTYLKDVHCPALIMHSEQDEIVPYGCAELNMEAANEPKRLYTISEAPHNNADLLDPDRYYAVIREFLSELTEWGE